MSESLKVIRFDVASLPPSDVEKLQKRIDTFKFISETKIDPEMHKTIYIRAYFDMNINVEELIKGLDGVKYADITGTDLMKS